MSTQDKILADVIDKLEQKKLNDMKNILKDFTHIQIIFHAKALEMLTTSYKYLLQIDTESDLEEFRNNFTQSTISNLQYNSNKSLNESMISTSGRSKNNLDQSRSKSNESRRNMVPLNSLNQKQKNSKSHSSAPNLNENKKKNMYNYDDQDDDDKENDEVEDVTDDSDSEIN